MDVLDEFPTHVGVNPNKMSLGFASRRGYWRSSVEAVQMLSTPAEVEGLGAAFAQLWEQATPAPSWEDKD